MTHYLKIWTKYYDQISRGDKTFELRKNDRNFQQGDFLVLEEYDNRGHEYLGRQMLVRVTYVYNGGEGTPVAEGYCILGIKIVPEYSETGTTDLSRYSVKPFAEH